VTARTVFPGLLGVVSNVASQADDFTRSCPETFGDERRRLAAWIPKLNTRCAITVEMSEIADVFKPTTPVEHSLTSSRDSRPREHPYAVIRHGQVLCRGRLMRLDPV
jgi:hypothetical protein